VQVLAMIQDTAAKAAESAPPPPPAPAIDATQVMSDLATKPIDTVSKWTEKGIELAIIHGPGVIGALVILTIGWIISGWARRIVINAMTKAHIEITLAKFFGNLTKWTILFFVVITSLGTLGVSTTGFAAVIAASGLAIGLALQGNLGNLASGVLLLIFRPFKVGDAVVVAGQAGVVDGIDLFTTNLDTGDNRRIIVPNGAIFGGVIENQTRHPRRLVTLAVPVSGAANLDETKKLLEGVTQRVLEQVPGTLSDPAPAVTLSDLAPTVTWTIAIWAETPKFINVRPVLLREVKLAIDGAKIGPPGPAMDVRIKEMPGQ
jgi:small conductance mechanosensitive channel